MGTTCASQTTIKLKIDSFGEENLEIANSGGLNINSQRKSDYYRTRFQTKFKEIKLFQASICENHHFQFNRDFILNYFRWQNYRRIS